VCCSLLRWRLFFFFPSVVPKERLVMDLRYCIWISYYVELHPIGAYPPPQYRAWFTVCLPHLDRFAAVNIQWHGPCTLFLTTRYSTRSHLRKAEPLVVCLTAYVPYSIKNKIADNTSWPSARLLSRRYSLLECHTVSRITRKCNMIQIHKKNMDSDYSCAPGNDVSVNEGPHVRRWSHKIII
jgi:hypothetical protein